MSELKIDWDHKFPVIISANSCLPFIRKGKKSESQGALVTVLQEELQSLKKASENVYITIAKEFFQTTLSPQTISFTKWHLGANYRAK